MPKNTLTLLTLLFMATALSADTIPLLEYKFSLQIEDEILSGEARLSSAAQDYSYIGKYQKALTIPNTEFLEWGLDTLIEEEKDHLLSFKPVNAVDYILNRAGEEQVVILNEAHHKPVHRIFTRQLLKGLYERGYRYFGLEALSSNQFDTTQLLLDTLLQERVYPYNSYLTGTYTTEPQMGMLVREAIRLGFTVFAYERHRSGDRELIQAQNIKRHILDKDPDAKILLHCGWYHLLEKENQGWRWMATYLKDLTGIDPLTIYQDIFNERYSTPESPYYQLVQADEPSVLVNEAGEVYNGLRGYDMFDIMLYHPRTRYIYNRPHWMWAIEGVKTYRIEEEQLQIDYPILVKAFKADEPKEATPIDITEIEHQWYMTALVLPPGDYRLELSNPAGERQVLEVRVE